MSKNVIDITLNNKDVIANSTEKKVIKMLLLDRSEYFYNKLTDKEIDKIIDKIGEIKKCVIKTIKSTYIKEQIIHKYSHLKNNVKKITNDLSNMNILEISKKYKNTPLTIIRIILQSYMSKEKVKKIFKNPSLLPSDIYKQFELAMNNDYYSISSKKQMQEAINFELKIEEYLIEKKIKYKTQDMLSKEQIEEFGKAINTPDFLITSDLTINNKSVNWIDAKNFYGMNSKFIISKINKQIEKYINKYGPGCIIFSCGYNEKLNFNNVLLLSYDDLE